jgi:hypothetical protein
MSTQIESFQATQFSLISDELEKLFVFQDKHLSKEKKAILVEEIQRYGFPQSAVIHGIRALMADDMPAIKLFPILASIRKFMIPEEQTSECKECLNGIVLMRDQNLYEFALACVCGRGKQINLTQRLMLWNGEETQLNHGRSLLRK